MDVVSELWLFGKDLVGGPCYNPTVAMIVFRSFMVVLLDLVLEAAATTPWRQARGDRVNER